MALLVLFIAYALQVRYRPYLSPSEKGEVIRDHVYRSLHGGVHQHLASLVREAEAHGRKVARNTRMTAAVKRPTSIVMVSAVLQYFFNYNTVEMVLLFCCILVTLAGIMFDSDRFQDSTFNSQKDVITAIVILVIVASIVYCTSLPLHLRSPFANSSDVLSCLMFRLVIVVLCAVVAVVVVEVYVVQQQRKATWEQKQAEKAENGELAGDGTSSDANKSKRKFGISGTTPKRPPSSGSSGRSLEMQNMAMRRDEVTMEFVPDLRTIRTEVCYLLAS